MRDVRQALVPGIFFGLNLAVFFAGATHNSVANAALIGSLAPFLIVPVGAWLFSEYIDPRALVFAVVAFGGVALVLFSAPPNGDASLEGNVFGVIAMLLLVGVRRVDAALPPDMDVATFMATICPIAAVAVLPLAIAHGDVFGLSGTGWTYMLILTLHQRGRRPGADGVRAEDDPDRHDRRSPRWRSPRSRSCGRSCCSARWCNDRQIAGIAIVVGGLLAFVVLNQRGDAQRGRSRRARSRELPDRAARRSGRAR